MCSTGESIPVLSDYRVPTSVKARQKTDLYIQISKPKMQETFITKIAKEQQASNAIIFKTIWT